MEHSTASHGKMPPMTAAAPDSITITRPDDWHLHLRDGAPLRTVVPHAAARFRRALLMPNPPPPLRPPHPQPTPAPAGDQHAAGAGLPAAHPGGPARRSAVRAADDAVPHRPTA